MIFILLIILLAYGILIGEFALASPRWDFEDINKPIQSATNEQKPVCFTLIIPFRNEALNLPRLLTSIHALSYPKDLYEVLLVNDASQDQSVKIITSFLARNPSLPIRCIPAERNTKSPKKDAIVTGIHHSTFNWIVTTDADCTWSPQWLSILSYFINEQRPKMVVGPVCIETTQKPTLLNAFEQLDFLSLMGATIGGFGLRKPFLCNGAHLAYQKKAFLEVQGFTENDHIASGDDHFLLEKFIQHFPKYVRYLKSQEAIVTTQPQESWASFISQRVRWASKGTAFTYWFSKFVGILVLLANITLLIAFVVLTIATLNQWLRSGLLDIFTQALFSPLLGLGVLLKFFVDYWLINKTALFMSRKNYLKWFVIVFLLYPFISTYISFKALTSDFVWKERRYKR